MMMNDFQKINFTNVFFQYLFDQFPFHKVWNSLGPFKILTQQISETKKVNFQHP